MHTEFEGEGPLECPFGTTRR